MTIVEFLRMTVRLVAALGPEDPRDRTVAATRNPRCTSTAHHLGVVPAGTVRLPFLPL
jgi:hypothetical protein